MYWPLLIGTVRVFFNSEDINYEESIWKVLKNYLNNSLKNYLKYTFVFTNNNLFIQSYEQTIKIHCKRSFHSLKILFLGWNFEVIIFHYYLITKHNIIRKFKARFSLSWFIFNQGRISLRTNVDLFGHSRHNKLKSTMSLRYTYSKYNLIQSSHFFHLVYINSYI